MNTCCFTFFWWSTRRPSSCSCTASYSQVARGIQQHTLSPTHSPPSSPSFTHKNDGCNCYCYTLTRSLAFAPHTRSSHHPQQNSHATQSTPPLIKPRRAPPSPPAPSVLQARPPAACGPPAAPGARASGSSHSPTWCVWGGGCVGVVGFGFGLGLGLREVLICLPGGPLPDSPSTGTPRRLFWV